MPTVIIRSVCPQLAAFAFCTVGWIMSSVTTGLVQWRVWHIANTTVINSGIAWIGIWRTCFFSHILVSPNLKQMYCQEFGPQQFFVPPEIFVAQGLMLVAIIFGLVGKACTAYALKNVYQGATREALITPWFTAGGVFCLAAGTCILIPVCWNLNSVVQNKNISFPEVFYMPSSPESQAVGAAIPIGILTAVVMVMSGSILLCYRLPNRSVVNPLALEEGSCTDSQGITTTDSYHSTDMDSSWSIQGQHIRSNGINNTAFAFSDDL